MKNLVCLDRDGTINEDNNYYLGSSDNWRDQVTFLEGVVEGIKRLNSLPQTEVFIITNQSGVALQGDQFDNLTEERMHEVNRHIIELLSEQGAHVRGYFACPFVDEAYVKKAQNKGRNVHQEYIDNQCRDLKPNIGMLEKCAQQLGASLQELELYVIGDRISDVQLGLNGGGKGILVASQKTIELGDVEKSKRLQEENSSRIYIANSFNEAANYVKRNITPHL